MIPVSEKVSTRINHIKRGIAFPISSFYELGSRTSVQKSFSRLSKVGIIERVSKGFYARPKPLANMPSVKTTANVTQIAYAWAKEHGYKIAPQGLESAYRLGLQTQAPVKPVFWSNGPSRQFKIGKEVAEVRHITEQKLRWINMPEGILLRGLSVTPPESVQLAILQKAINRLSLSKKESKRVIHKLRSSSLPKAWQNKLQAFEKMIA